MLIAGGGTGGHLFPGLALAEEIVRRDPGNEVLFVGTARGLEARHVPRNGFELQLISVGALKGRGIRGWITGLLRLPRAVWQSRRIIKKFSPEVVVGVGGYSSGPVLLAAWLRRLPTVILEQNALPGMTNRWLGKIVRAVVTAFPEARKFFSAGKVHLLGNPVRRALAENLEPAGRKPAGKHLLIFGGSQGARALNQVVPQAAALLMRHITNLQIVHQTGEPELEQVERLYAELGLTASVLPFIDDMASAYHTADLVVCRAGATTLAELSLSRKPAVLIPFPHAADNHQEVNARALVEVGAAIMIRQSELSAERLSDELSSILEDPERMASMAEASAAAGKPAAAREICDLCIALAGGARVPAGEGA